MIRLKISNCWGDFVLALLGRVRFLFENEHLSRRLSRYTAVVTKYEYIKRKDDGQSQGEQASFERQCAYDRSGDEVEGWAKISNSRKGGRKYAPACDGGRIMIDRLAVMSGRQPFYLALRELREGMSSLRMQR